MSTTRKYGNATLMFRREGAGRYVVHFLGTVWTVVWNPMLPASRRWVAYASAVDMTDGDRTLDDALRSIAGAAGK
jgi:hypothetical protein